MLNYQQITRYGIKNPYDRDAMEGDWVRIRLKDGRIISGCLVDVSYAVFALRNAEGKTEQYYLEDIQLILEVEPQDC